MLVFETSVIHLKNCDDCAANARVSGMRGWHADTPACLLSGSGARETIFLGELRKPQTPPYRISPANYFTCKNIAKIVQY